VFFGEATVVCLVAQPPSMWAEFTDAVYDVIQQLKRIDRVRAVDR
jgi:hypothetical protein